MRCPARLAREQMIIQRFAFNCNGRESQGEGDGVNCGHSVSICPHTLLAIGPLSSAMMRGESQEEVQVRGTEEIEIQRSIGEGTRAEFRAAPAGLD